jgi:Zn-dependent protease with chaperone function
LANFFEQQAQARSATTRLVVLYILAVLVICTTIAFAVSLFTKKEYMGYRVDQSVPTAPDFTAEAIAGLITLGIIGVGTFVRMKQLGGSGVEVAVLLGGVPVDPATSDPLEKRLFNVVEEMAIASGIPVPRVFILKHEGGINAFAAGMKPGEAVVGVTRGTLEQLNRDELQGVIAHEFSHIFNGDMRLNLRLMGVLGGILTLTTIGRLLLDTDRGRVSRKKDGNALVFIGLVMIVVGWIGVFFARLIKAAVSRQREYLADASAVQYTRNPQGIGGALMKIGGSTSESRVTAPFAEEASHMFFGSVSKFSALFATHPALEERIKRISPALLQGGWKPHDDLGDQSIESAAAFAPLAPSLVDAGAQPRAPRSQTEAAAARASAIVATVGEPTLEDLFHAKEKLGQIPQEVRDQLRTGIGAVSAVLALLLQSESGSSAQAAMITSTLDAQTLQYAQDMHRAMGESVHADRLTILELAIPALRELDSEEQRTLLLLCRDLVHADGRYDLFEYVALTLLDHQFFGSTRRHRPRPRINGAKTTNDLSTVISAIAHAGTDDITKAKAAFDAGVNAIRETNPYPLTFRSSDECRLQTIADSIDRLSFLEPNSQKVVVDACVRTVIHDKVVNQDEAELLKVICTVLEAPLPALAV